MAKGNKSSAFVQNGIPGQCNYCGETKNLTTDHIIARCLGGARTGDNLQKLCRFCHDAKGRIEQAAIRESPAGLYKEATLMYTKQTSYTRIASLA